MTKSKMTQEQYEKRLIFMQRLNSNINPRTLQLMDHMRIVSHTLYQRGEESLVSAGLSYARFRLLMSLYYCEEMEDRPELNPSEISSKQGISRNTVSTLIRDLETEGLIERHLDQTDRRKFNIKLTDNGRSRVRDHANQHLQVIEAHFNALTAVEQEDLIHLLTKLRNSFICK